MKIKIIRDFSLQNYKYYLQNKNLIKPNLFCLILEPLTDTLDLGYNKKMLKRLLNNNINIITYSESNLLILKNKLQNRQYFCLPINYYNYPDENYLKSIDFVINHRDISGYSKGSRLGYNNTIISSDNVFLKKCCIFNHWGQERDLLFVKTKIFINLHKSKESKILETIRIYNLIKNRVIIISQKCYRENLEDLSKYIIFVDDNNLILKAEEVLEKYQDYYKKIYGNLTNKDIFDGIENKYNNFKSYLENVYVK